MEGRGRRVGAVLAMGQQRAHPQCLVQSLPFHRGALRLSLRPILDGSYMWWRANPRRRRRRRRRRRQS